MLEQGQIKPEETSSFGIFPAQFLKFQLSCGDLFRFSLSLMLSFKEGSLPLDGN